MMKSIIFAAAILVFLGIGFQESALSLIRVSVGTVVLAITGVVGVIFASYVKQVYYKKNRPPVAGPVFFQLLNFDKIFDYLTDHAKKNITFRMIAPTHSEIYTADPVVVEYILKTNFPNYEKVKILNFLQLCSSCIVHVLIMYVIVHSKTHFYI